MHSSVGQWFLTFLRGDPSQKNSLVFINPFEVSVKSSGTFNSQHPESAMMKKGCVCLCLQSELLYTLSIKPILKQILKKKEEKKNKHSYRQCNAKTILQSKIWSFSFFWKSTWPDPSLWTSAVAVEMWRTCWPLHYCIMCALSQYTLIDWKLKIK